MPQDEDATPRGTPFPACDAHEAHAVHGAHGPYGAYGARALPYPWREDRPEGVKSVLFAVRSAAALHRLLDTLPVFAGDSRVRRYFTLVPGSDFDIEALAALEQLHARTVPWSEAVRGAFDLVLAASPKGGLARLNGPLVLLPHGAGFGKTVRGEGSERTASGLDPVFLLHEGQPLAAFHALAHPEQVDRLAAVSGRAAHRAGVVGDPTLDRILASAGHRERFRAALGTGARRLVVLSSTWGPESLLRRRPRLAAELVARLPRDEYQLALLVHPNEYSRLGGFELAERLAPALAAGLVLARPYEEWAALLLAADLVVCDHGSAALYAAALDRPLLSAHDGGSELLAGSPMARLLASVPRLEGAHSISSALRDHRAGDGRALAAPAFAERGRALELLRDELYKQLGLVPPPEPVEPRPLPAPAAPGPAPAAFAVRVESYGEERAEGTRGGPLPGVRVERYPVRTEVPVHFLGAEHGSANERHAQSAGLLMRRASAEESPGGEASWAAEGWTERLLREYPGCMTAAVVVSGALCLVRRRGGPLLRAEFAPGTRGARVVRPDPAAVLCAVHARLAGRPGVTADRFDCVLGEWAHEVRLSPATAEDARRPV